MTTTLMKKPKTKKLALKTAVDGANNGTDENWEAGEDDNLALDKARAEVISGLSERKRKSQKEKYWGDRPEHLRKGLGDMDAEEKRDYHLWMAGKLQPKSETPAPTVGVELEPERKLYTHGEVKRVGKMFLKFLARRMPIKKEVEVEEVETFAEVFTPLANKYMGGVGYADEIAGGVFLLSFLGARIGKEDAE